jgi:hypothetical protein
VPCPDHVPAGSIAESAPGSTPTCQQSACTQGTVVPAVVTPGVDNVGCDVHACTTIDPVNVTRPTSLPPLCSVSVGALLCQPQTLPLPPVYAAVNNTDISAPPYSPPQEVGPFPVNEGPIHTTLCPDVDPCFVPHPVQGNVTVTLIVGTTTVSQTLP